MGKKGKRKNADAVYAKKSTQKPNPFTDTTSAISKKLSPFEMHVNKAKFEILGRICKHDKGLPGVSRTKAIKRRVKTLGQEYKDKNKSNVFRDRRIGKCLNEENLKNDVLTARFVADRMAMTKSSIFDLNDEEVLTHRGQTLEEIEEFRDDRSDDDDLEDENLNADFIRAAHFGGDGTEVKDRQATIDEMILEQKRRKVEAAKEKDEVYNLTEKLDLNYKNLVGLMSNVNKSESNVKGTPDDYDKLLREMVFEPRGAVTDKLLAEEDLKKKEKQRLEMLEKERLLRMQDEDDAQDELTQSKHRSADDLDDGYFATDNNVEENGVLSYKLNGELSTDIFPIGKHNNQIESSEVESGNVYEGKDDKGDSDDSNVEEEEEESDEDNFSDLICSESEEDETHVEETDGVSEDKQQKRVLKHVLNGESKEVETVALYLPDSYDTFEQLLIKHTPEQQARIVERLIKCNHPKLGCANGEEVFKLFTYLLQYVDDLFSESTSDNIASHFKIVDKLNPHLYDLLLLNPEKMSKIFLNVIKEKYMEYTKRPKSYPPLSTVVFLKLVSNFFSTSDFRHPIVTPCYVFIQHVLSTALLHTRRDIASGLFLVTLALEFSAQSKRFLPAVFNFLLGIIYLCVPKRAVETVTVMEPFQSMGNLRNLLSLKDLNEDALPVTEEKLNSEDLVITKITNDFKIRALNSTLKFIKEAIATVSDNMGSNYLAFPFEALLVRLPLHWYPKFVSESYEVTNKLLREVGEKALTKLTPPEKKPKALRLLEPRIELVYDDKRRPRMSKEKEQHAKLLHKVKRETKGAIREIRRDTEFIQKERLRQQLQSDMERKQKVKRLYQEASIQQGELNEFSRAKKKKF